MNNTAIRTRTVAPMQMLSRLLASGNRDSLEQLLKVVADSLGLVGVGIRWPIPGTAQIYAVVGGAVPDDHSKWGADLVSRLSGARSINESFFDPADPCRLLVPVIADGRRNGAFWAIGHEPISHEDSQAIVVAVQCIVRHPAFVERMSLPQDQTLIAQRIQDAAAAAGRIAHDFDNIFTGVVGFAEILQSMLEPETQPHQYVSEIAAAGNRGIVFTQQLHQLSRSGAGRPMPSTLGHVLAREEARFKKLPNLNVKVQIAVANELPPVAIEAGALQQLLGVFLDNAIEASPAGGAVRVNAALIELSEAEAREHLGSASAGPFVEIRVADDGPGIRDDYRKKLFVEPFFTTKVRHRGLGLPIAYRILSAHRGGARCAPGQSRGSVFHVVLPLAAARVPESGGTPLKSPASQESTQHEYPR